jgi:hypothetical protein
VTAEFPGGDVCGEQEISAKLLDRNGTELYLATPSSTVAFYDGHARSYKARRKKESNRIYGTRRNESAVNFASALYEDGLNFPIGKQAQHRGQRCATIATGAHEKDFRSRGFEFAAASIQGRVRL